MSKKTIIISSILVGVGALALYGYNMYKLTDKLCFNVTKYKVRSISLQNARIDLTLNVRNLGALAIKVRRFTFKVYSEGVFLGEIYSNEILDITPNNSGDTTVQLLFNPKTLVNNAKNIILDSISGDGLKNIPFSMRGGISVSKAGIPFYIPFIYDFKLGDFIEGEESESIC